MDINKLRDAFADKKPAKTQNNFSNAQSDYYPFWQMPVDSQAIVRFLPDKNEENPRGFLVEKRMHELTVNGKTRKVPCNYMYGDKCPICEASQTFYQSGDETNGKKYWRKISYIAQALVLEDPIPAPSPLPEGYEAPLGTVKLLSITYTLYKIIKDAFESGEMDVPPFFYDEGTNFIIKKDQQGDHASYVLSKFSRRSDNLDPEVVEYVKEQIKDLSDVLPKAYSYEKLQALLDADLTGKPYQDENSDKPASSAPTASASSRVAEALASKPAAPTAKEEAPADKPAAEEKPAAPTAAEDASARGNSIVEQIKRKREAQLAAAAAAE